MLGFFFNASVFDVKFLCMGVCLYGGGCVCMCMGVVEGAYSVYAVNAGDKQPVP